MIEKLNYIKFIELGNFTKLEEKTIHEINEEIEKSGKTITYIINKDNPYAKFHYKKNEITIPNINDYNSLIHELLHVELILIYNFPTIEDVNIYLKDYNLFRLKGVIASITNDIHHFIFYEKFYTLTKHLKNNTIISNQKKLLKNSFPYNYLVEKYNRQPNNLKRISFYYESFFIIDKYKNLLRENINSINNSIKLDYQLYQIFNNFFNSILLIKFKDNILTNKNSVIERYKEFYKKIEINIKLNSF